MKRFVVASLISALAASSVACSDSAAPDPVVTVAPVTDSVVTVEPVGVVVSSAMQAPVVSASVGEVAYVSIAPQTYPNAVSFEIGNRSGGAVQSFPATEGGLDPVAIPARAGDVVNITVRTSTGAPTSLALNVPVRRPPVVVRTNPAKGRVDVALNVNVSVVFSEPIDGKSLDTAALQLRHDGVPSSGSLRLSNDALTADFAPDNPLLPLTTYELLVTPNVHDVSGQSLPAQYSSTFTTCPYYALQSSCPPFPTGGSNSVSGVVFERTATGTTPLANVQIWTWVQYSNGNGYSHYAATSDATGHYRVDGLPNTGDGLPNATIYLQTDLEGYDEPCSSTLNLNGSNPTVNLEMVSKSHPLPELATSLPSITGVVYEMTPNGRKPIAGAWVEYDPMGGMGLIEATTTTDENGRYAICNLASLPPWPSNVAAGKTGYQWVSQDLHLAGAMQLDFELKPQ
jgi:Bacterial Ig-like domain